MLFWKWHHHILTSKYNSPVEAIVDSHWMVKISRSSGHLDPESQKEVKAAQINQRVADCILRSIQLNRGNSHTQQPHIKVSLWLKYRSAFVKKRWKMSFSRKYSELKAFWVILSGSVKHMERLSDQTRKVKNVSIQNEKWIRFSDCEHHVFGAWRVVGDWLTHLGSNKEPLQAIQSLIGIPFKLKILCVCPKRVRSKPRRRPQRIWTFRVAYSSRS